MNIKAAHSRVAGWELEVGAQPACFDPPRRHLRIQYDGAKAVVKITPLFNSSLIFLVFLFFLATAWSKSSVLRTLIHVSGLMYNLGLTMMAEHVTHFTHNGNSCRHYKVAGTL